MLPISFASIALTLLGKVDSYSQHDPTSYRNLETVYGSMSNRETIEQAQKRLSMFERPVLRKAADDPRCEAPFDIMILQDATGSFEVDYAITANVTLPALKQRLDSVAPNSTYSLVTFRDKPLPRLGEPTDDCFTVHHLNVPDPLEFKQTFLYDIPTGGNDFPENQFGALVAVASSPKTIPWHTDKSRIPVIFLITDAAPHFENDGTSAESGPMLPYGDESYDEDKAEEYCKKRFYPSATVVRDVLLNSHMYLGVVVQRPNGPGKALATWQWFNGYVGYPPQFTQPAGDEMSGWIEEFVALLKQISEEHCAEGTPTYFPTWTPEKTEGPSREGRPFWPSGTESVSFQTGVETETTTTTRTQPPCTSTPRTTTERTTEVPTTETTTTAEPTTTESLCTSTPAPPTTTAEITTEPTDTVPPTATTTDGFFPCTNCGITGLPTKTELPTRTELTTTEFFVTTVDTASTDSVWCTNCGVTPIPTTTDPVQITTVDTASTDLVWCTNCGVTPIPTTTDPVQITTVDTASTPDVEKTTPPEICECPSQPEGTPSPCCFRQPEVLIALMRQPEELDIHFRGHVQPNTSLDFVPAVADKDTK